MSKRENENQSAARLALHEAADTLLRSRQKKVLLVEDTAAHAAIIKRILGAKGWETEHVTRGSAARDAFERDPSKIVLLDLSLPDIDGLSLLRQLRTFNEHAALIVVTATDLVSVSVEAMQQGAWDYVVKDSPETVTEKLLNAVERAWSRRLAQAEDSLIQRTKLHEIVQSERTDAIDVVIRTVCHEVNNPLSGVIAFSQLLLQQPELSEQEQKLADGIHRCAKEVQGAVEKLKDISDNVVEFGGREILESLPAKADSSDEPQTIETNNEVGVTESVSSDARSSNNN